MGASSAQKAGCQFELGQWTCCRNLTLSFKTVEFSSISSHLAVVTLPAVPFISLAASRRKKVTAGDEKDEKFSHFSILGGPAGLIAASTGSPALCML